MSEKLCEVCQDPFTPYLKDQKYCSNLCRFGGLKQYHNDIKEGKIILPKRVCKFCLKLKNLMWHRKNMKQRFF